MLADYGAAVERMHREQRYAWRIESSVERSLVGLVGLLLFLFVRSFSFTVQIWMRKQNATDWYKTESIIVCVCVLLNERRKNHTKQMFTSTSQSINICSTITIALHGISLVEQWTDKIPTYRYTLCARCALVQIGTVRWALMLQPYGMHGNEIKTEMVRTLLRCGWEEMAAHRT